MVPIKPVSPDYFIPGRFKGKTILIIGAGSGMGAAAASGPLARELISRV